MSSQSQRTEEIVTLLLPRFTGTLSIFGSSAIILSMMINGKQKLKSSFNRLLFMMCFFDLSSSIANVWSSSALPKDDNHYGYGAAGNWTTCRMQGFLYQLGMAVPIYFYFLTIHYLLVIRYGMKEERIRRRIEPFMHCFAILCAFGTGISSWILKIFNPNFGGCWIMDYPKDCSKHDSDVDCIYGENVEFYRWLYGGLPSILPLFLVPFTMGWIFWTVRKQTLKMKKYDPNRICDSSTSTTRQSFTRVSFTMRQSFTMGQSTPRDDVSTEFDLSSTSNYRQKLNSKTAERLQAVAHQGLVYSLCYLFVFSMPIIMYLFMGYAEDHKPPFFVVVLFSIFYPLQGFLNYIIYIRPFVAQIRKTHPDWSILHAMCVATFPKRPGRTNSMSICEKLNCRCRNRDGNKNKESIVIEFQSKSGANSDQGSGRDNDVSRKELDPEEEKEEENDQLGTAHCYVKDAEETLIEDLMRSAMHNNKSKQEFHTEQEIKGERELFEAITELSKITGNYS